MHIPASNNIYSLHTSFSTKNRQAFSPTINLVLHWCKLDCSTARCTVQGKCKHVKKRTGEIQGWSCSEKKTSWPIISCTLHLVRSISTAPQPKGGRVKLFRHISFFQRLKPTPAAAAAASSFSRSRLEDKIITPVVRSLGW